MNLGFFNQIVEAISLERLDVYRRDGVDEVTTLARYLWNIALCEALYCPLQMAEVVLRNAAHRACTDKYNGEAWYDHAPLAPWAKWQIDNAKDKIRKIRKPVTPGRVVSELHFGFWTSFFNNVNARSGLGACLLKNGFQCCPKHERNTKTQEKRWDKIRRLRNRVFHHERIIHWSDLSEQHAKLIEAISWLSPEIEKMTLNLDRFSEIFKAGIDPWKVKIRGYWPKDDAGSVKQGK